MLGDYMKKTSLLLFICLLLLSLSFARAQSTVIFKNGKKLEGKIVEKTDKHVIIDIDGTKTIYPIDKIKSIDYKIGNTINNNELSGLSNKLVTIKGRVIFEEWQQGSILIAAISTPQYINNATIIYDTVTIGKPGPYTLNVPLNLKKIYLGWYNDSNNDGSAYQPHDPGGWYQNDKDPHALYLTNIIMENINLYADDSIVAIENIL
jgi:hypothetical protein